MVLGSWNVLVVAGIVVAAVVAIVLGLLIGGLRVIGEQESGLVIKKFGRPLASGRLIARDGEAGYQAALLSPGWHLFMWRWEYKLVKVPVVVVQPGEIALVVAADGLAVPSERVLGKEVACDSFQDAEAFLAGGGERGRQLAFLTAGSYRINPALFEVVTAARAERYDMRPEQLKVYQLPSERVGIVSCQDGLPIVAGDLAGRSSMGMTASSAASGSSRPAARVACRSRCCSPARGT